MLETLSAEEKKKARAFVKREDYERYVLSHFYLRKILTKYVPEIGEKAWRFSHNLYGKPRIANAQKTALHFNLSHSNTAVAVVCSSEADCGIDAESKKNMQITEGMCELVFSKEELYLYRSLSAAMQEQMFYRYWTMKEAHLKALGSGLMEMLPPDLNFGNLIVLNEETNSFTLEKGQYWSRSFDNESFLSFCLLNNHQNITPTYYFSV